MEYCYCTYLDLSNSHTLFADLKPDFLAGKIRSKTITAVRAIHLTWGTPSFKTQFQHSVFVSPCWHKTVSGIWACNEHLFLLEYRCEQWFYIGEMIIDTIKCKNIIEDHFTMSCKLGCLEKLIWNFTRLETGNSTWLEVS